MSKRLQVVFEDTEYAKIQQAADGKRMTVSEFVRSELRNVVEPSDVKPAAKKLRALERALLYNFPTCDIEQMNAEIEMGYAHGLP